jgi:hypothetical protein
MSNCIYSIDVLNKDVTDVTRHITTEVAKIIYPILGDDIKYVDDIPDHSNLILPNNTERVGGHTWETEENKYMLENPIHMLRIVRNSVLGKTDKYVIQDWPHKTEEDRQAWLDYRQALRDITKQDLSNLKLSLTGSEISGVTWPTPPPGF